MEDCLSCCQILGDKVVVTKLEGWQFIEIQGFLIFSSILVPSCLYQGYYISVLECPKFKPNKEIISPAGSLMYVADLNQTIRFQKAAGSLDGIKQATISFNKGVDSMQVELIEITTGTTMTTVTIKPVVR